MGRPPKKREKAPKVAAPSIRVKVRIGDNAIGPGKITLLAAVETERSISGAARVVGMSFRRAWHLIDTLNTALGRPVVETEVGGPGGGGARLTAFGDELVRRYRETLGALDDGARPFLDWLARP